MASRAKRKDPEPADPGGRPADFEKKRERWAKDHRLFCAEVLRIKDKRSPNGAKVIPLKWNDCQEALAALVERVKALNIKMSTAYNKVDPSHPISPFPVRVIILKPRKEGVSTWVQSRINWRCEFEQGTEGLIMAHELPAAQNIASISKGYINFRPEDAQPYLLQTPKKGDNLIEWEEPHSSKQSVKTAGTKTSGASRSYSYHILHISEEAHFTGDGTDEVAAALNAKMDFPEVYEESTANGEGNMFHRNWENALWIEELERLVAEGLPTPKGWNGRVRFFYAWHQSPSNRMPLRGSEAESIRESLDDEEKAGIDQFGWTLEQIKWRRHKIDTDCKDQNKLPPIEYFHQEFPSTPEEAFVTQGDTVFDQRKLKFMQEYGSRLFELGKMEHLRLERVGENQWIEVPTKPSNANFRVWARPKAGRHYVIGVDTAEGLEGGDYSVMSIFDRTNGLMVEEVARYRGKCDPEELGELAVQYGYIYNVAFLVPERAGPGAATCLKIARLDYPMVFHGRDIEMQGNRDSPERFTVGFQMHNQRRNILVGMGQSAVKDGNIILKDLDAIMEWKVFQKIDGKSQAPNGFNDDCVMADLLALFGNFGEDAAPPIRRELFDRVDPNDVEAEARAVETATESFWKRVTKLRKVAKKRAEREEHIKWRLNRYSVF